MPFQSILMLPAKPSPESKQLASTSEMAESGATTSKQTEAKGPEGAEKFPLVLYIHGGPHSIYPAEFNNFYAGFIQLGYAVLAVNYRGSIGFGEANVESLTGHIGERDVADCMQALDYTLSTAPVERSAVFLFGGSHGGFLVTHLMARCGDRFVAACSRNPVINLSTMAGLTDIPDWYYT